MKANFDCLVGGTLAAACGCDASECLAVLFLKERRFSAVYCGEVQLHNQTMTISAFSEG